MSSSHLVGVRVAEPPARGGAPVVAVGRPVREWRTRGRGTRNRACYLHL